MSYPDEAHPPIRAPQEPEAHDDFMREVERSRIIADEREAMRRIANALLREYAHQQRRGLSPVFEVEPADARTPEPPRRPGITLAPEPRIGSIDAYLESLTYTAPRRRED